ncbi:MAG: cbb3-type cytochrome oxidase assembly protein CcoS [Rubrivivax sp.]|jgi:cbb3-type cytochrome oxidase maturation protein
MEILYLLIPLSAVLVLLIIALFGWALHKGQFEDLEGEGERFLRADTDGVDRDQGAATAQPEQSLPVRS